MATVIHPVGLLPNSARASEFILYCPGNDYVNCTVAYEEHARHSRAAASFSNPCLRHQSLLTCKVVAPVSLAQLIPAAQSAHAVGVLTLIYTEN
ncbi:hypothetical protein C3F09_01100 [candidate division GN15 bacterium]|uniref:Uncharacterized protein n=1 Tax=candidate division GN15 bacterium TaxID=2072418 RepID=A0A855X4F2_9BACT|nr:MAG: hypothetical protein C3F09_01100 [candidate division GN15 bacterium]